VLSCQSIKKDGATEIAARPPVFTGDVYPLMDEMGVERLLKGVERAG
jgi:hypothetical protein